MPRQLLGTAIAANTITTTQLQTTVVNQISAGGGPRVSSLIYPGNDTAGNTVGGQTVYINGSGFETNNAIYINGNAVPSKSFISASNLSFTTPALAAGIYPVYVINTDNGATAIFVPGYISSAEPTWVTGSSLSEVGASDAWSISLSATGDAPITYALANGSSLPSGINLAANGLISGTLSSPPESDTQYTFTVVATDAQNQDASRQFTITTSVGEGLPFANNVLLIHADGTNNGNNHSFLDSSNNNFTITRNGNATQGSFSPFSQTGWSGYFDGTTDAISFNSIELTSDFTIEAWLYPERVGNGGGNQAIIFGQSSPNNQFAYNADGTIGYYNGSASTVTSATISLERWTHVAWVRSGSSTRIYINGANSAINSSDSGSRYVQKIGEYPSPTGYAFKGFISNARVTANAMYSGSSFSLPTSPLSVTANTKLLTLNSNRFVDSNTTPLTITRDNDTKIISFSPFAPTAAYSTSTVGGSGYFDGSGDRLTLPSSSNLVFGTGDFCVELWAYFNANPAGMMFITNIADSDTQFAFRVDASGYPKVQGWFTNFAISSATVVANQWYHLVACRVSNTLSIFINGTRTATATVSNNFSSTSAFTIGGPSSDFSGFMSGLRITKGSSPYDATQASITVPTTPVTAIANTQLLLNFTNAGIFDQTGKTILETVGDAKVSTTQYKYGTGSMYFDGDGDYLVTPGSPILSLGTGDFTVECWLYNLGYSGSQYGRGFFTIYPTAGYTDRLMLRLGNSAETNNRVNMYLAVGGTGKFGVSGTLSTAAITPNTWVHVAFVRQSGAYKLYINGTLDTTISGVTDNISNLDKIEIGRNQDGTVPNFYGYIDDFRYTKGYARYTSNFTPPTSALKDK